jgi:hypothetical protein
MTDNNRLHNGQFAKGNPGKPKGSSKNKLRDEIRTFLNDNWSNFPEWFSKLKPMEKINTMLDLMPYAVSRLQSVNLTDQEGNDLPKATIDYSKLPEDVLRQVLNATTINSDSDERT